MQYEDKLYLGVDGGGSKTEGVLCSLHFDGRGYPVLNTHREASGGPSNWLGAAEPNKKSADSLQAVLNDLLNIECADLLSSLSTIVMATAGIGLPGRRETLMHLLDDIFPAGICCHVIGDVQAAHCTMGIFDGGITVIAGTGSVAVSHQSRSWTTVGGHGFVLGDEGSGFWIGQKALQAAVCGWEGRGPKTNLTQRAKQYFDISTLDELPREIYLSGRGIDAQRIAGFAPHVSRATQLGDAVAAHIVKSAGYHLADHVLALARKEGNILRECLGIHPVGGAWQVSSLLENFLQRLSEEGLAKPCVSSPLYNAAQGAVIWAGLHESDHFN